MAHRQQLKTCSACFLNINNPQATQPVSGIGYAGAKALLLGEGPGEQENATGLPFKGRSGQLLQKCLQQLNIPLQHLYITNVVKHRPPQNRNPTTKEMHTCITRFLCQEINIIKPKLIICLGRVPTIAMHLIQNKKLSPGSCYGLKFLYKDIPVLSTWHPAYILRNRTKHPDLLKDLAKIKEI
jgi:uracil-DNA glycosylase